jgi:flagellar basal-body rod protein FlgG
MIEALYIANSGLRSQQTQLEIISNNVANIQTPGFKKARVNFADLAYRNGITPEIAATQSAAGQLVGSGTRITSTHAVFSDGEIKMTGNPLDVAIRGTGMLEVMTEKGQPAYTRAAQLRIDRDGFLVTLSGHRLTGGIQIPPDAAELLIRDNGEVHAEVAGDLEPMLLGQLDLARFTNMDGLRPMGNGLFAATEQSGEAFHGRAGEDGMGVFMQGFIETSNVDMIDEMTGLMLAQRAYQLNARLLQTADQVLETLNNLRR